jgi:hypothetical protein
VLYRSFFLGALVEIWLDTYWHAHESTLLQM